MRATREADVAVLLKELEDGTWKGSFRSKGATDVGAVAQALGGGGHALAAGFEVAGPARRPRSRRSGTPEGQLSEPA